MTRRRVIALFMAPAFSVALQACRVAGLLRGPGAERPANLEEKETTGPPAVPEVGRPAPDFTLPALDGGRLSLSSLRGKPVVLNFFASWCGPCLAELPEFQQAALRHRHHNLVALLVNLQEDRRTVEEFAGRLGLRTPMTPIVLDQTGEVAVGRYRLRGLPTSVFIDRAGVIRAIHPGPVSGPQLERYVSAIVS